jgi:hypothetical protein
MADEELGGGWRYLARSFVLPLLGMLGTFALAYRIEPAEWKLLIYPGGLFGAFAGLFQVDQVVKVIWGARVSPPVVPPQA